MADEEKKYLIKVESNIDEYAKKVLEADEAVNKFIEANKELLATQDETNVEYKKAKAELAVLQKSRQDANKTVQEAVRVQKAAKGSYEELYRAWKNAQVQLKLMPGAYTINEKGVRSLSKAYVDQSKKVADMKKSLDEFGRGVHDNRLNVGNYTDSIKTAIGEMNMMPGVLGQATSQIQRFGVALKALALNPLVLAITAVVGALVGLFKALKSTDTYGTNFQARLEQIKAVLDVVRTRVIAFADAVKSIFKGDFKEAGEKFKETFTGIGEQIKEATGAAWDYVHALDTINDSQNNFISDAAELENKIAKLQFQAMDRRLSDEKRLAASKEAMRLSEQLLTKEAQFAKDKFEMEAKYLAERNGLRQEDVIGFIKMTDEEQKNASQSLKTLRDNNEDKFAEIENLYAEWIKKDTQFYSENRRNVSKLGGFIEELEKEKEAAVKKGFDTRLKIMEIEAGKDAQKMKQVLKWKYEQEIANEKLTNDEKLLLKLEYDTAIYEIDQKAIKDSQAALTKEVEEYKKSQEEKRKVAEEQAAWEQERLLIDAENRLQIKELNYENEFDIQREALDLQYQQEILAAEKSGADITLIYQKYAAARRQIDQMELESKLGVYSEFAGSIASLFGEQTAIGKAAAVAQATINTYLAATRALASYPPPANYIAMAAAIVAGFAQVKKILSVKSGLPGEGKYSAPTSMVATAPAQRIYAQQTGASYLTQPQLSQSQLNATSNQTLLTAEDIASAIAKIPPPIVTVEDINAKAAQKTKVDVRATI
jgi:hypothetical protein